jgi:hypothetical protein
MELSRDEKIEKILQDLYKRKSIPFGDYIYYEFGDSNDNVNRNECDKIIDILCHHNLMHQTSDNIYTITTDGIQIIENGGWLKHQADQIKEKLSLEKIQNMEFEKLFWESRLVKWQVKVFWPLIGLVSLVWQIIDKSKL